MIVTEACAVEKVREFAAERGVPVVTVDGAFDGCVEFREVLAAEELDADADPDPDPCCCCCCAGYAEPDRVPWLPERAAVPERGAQRVLRALPGHHHRA
ncbi:hypothetical protein L9G15_21795, partial [Shewanella sp. A3A]|nr:hypothetical protein [Shewanella ferrihydritica]